MRKFSSDLFLLLALLTTRALASPLPQENEKEKPANEGEDEEEEEEEGEDEYYEDEERRGSTSKPEVVTESAEELDKDDLEDAAIRKELSQRLGIKNYTSSALADKATNVVLAFIASRYAKETPKPALLRKPVTKIRTTTVKSTHVAVTTVKYKILRSTSIPIPREDVETTRKFLITVPQDKAGSGGGTIEISIPTNMTSESIKPGTEDINTHHHLSQMSILGEDAQGVKNIEAAIMEALLIAQQMTGMKMAAVMSGDNDKDVIELDIKDLTQITAESMLENQTRLNLGTKPTNATEIPIVSSESPQRSEVESETSQPTEILEQTPSSVAQEPKPINIASTTPKVPKIPDPLGLGPLTDLFVSQIRNGKLPTFVWGSIVKLSNSKYAKIAVDAVECAVFYYCPDDTELGTLSEGAKF